jgi:cytochrome c2
MGWRHIACKARQKRSLIPLAAIALLAAGLPPAAAAGNAASGRLLYQARCVGCHGEGSSSGATLGPSLVGVIGRKAGTGESGVHSRALVESNIRWDEASLRWFLTGPIEGTTTMPAPVLDAQQIEDLIAYLKTLR